MPSVGFEPTIPAGERPHTHALDRTATGTGTPFIIKYNYLLLIDFVGDKNYKLEFHRQ